MKKSIGNQPPPFTIESQRSEVGAGTNQLLRRRIGEQSASNQPHEDVNSDVDSNQRTAQIHGAYASALPWTSDDRLRRVLRQFAALRSLVLHTPGAKSLPKREPRKLATTAGTISHYLKVYHKKRRSALHGRPAARTRPMNQRSCAKPLFVAKGKGFEHGGHGGLGGKNQKLTLGLDG